MSDLRISVEVKTFNDDKVSLMFSCDGGKFKTRELLDEFNLSAEKLLDILQANDTKTSDSGLTIPYVRVSVCPICAIEHDGDTGWCNDCLDRYDSLKGK